jgi:biotin carboxyl carrier protein
MKMENSIIAERNGVIKRVFIAPGQVIATNAVLIEYEK